MILMNEMIPMRVYSNKQKAYMPFNPVDKKKGAMVTLMTRSLDDSINLINTPWFINPSYFSAYYIDRNVKHFLSNDGNIKIEGEDEDPDSENGIVEAAISAMTLTKPTYTAYGSTNDKKLLETYFDKKVFDKWFDFFEVRKEKRHYPAIYSFRNLADMYKAIGSSEIVTDGSLMPNSFNTAGEIFLINGSEYNLEYSDATYELYCLTALITYICNTSFVKCSYSLANQVGCALSGQAEYLYNKNGYTKKDKVTVALIIYKMYKEEGKRGIIRMVRMNDYSCLSRYSAGQFIKRMSPIWKHEETLLEGKIKFKNDKGETVPKVCPKCGSKVGVFLRGEPVFLCTNKKCEKYFGTVPFNEEALLESDGTGLDVTRIFKSMDERDRHFISTDDSFNPLMPDKEIIYRHVEKDGLMGVKGFIQCYKDIDDSASVVIGVSPKYRGEGVGSALVEKMLKEFPKENPKISYLVWRADAKNHKSMKLAMKYGFELIRHSSLQSVYRYWIKNDHRYDDIPNDFKNDVELTKWCKRNFKIDPSIPVGPDYKIKSTKDILRNKNKLTEVDVEYFCYRALKKMGLEAYFVVCIEHNNGNDIGQIVPTVVYQYSGGNYIYMNPSNDLFGNDGICRFKQDIFEVFTILHNTDKWGNKAKYPYLYMKADYDYTLINSSRDINKIMGLNESALLEFTTKSKADENRPLSIQSNLNRFEKILLDKNAIDKYISDMPSLCHVRTNKNCHGYIWVNKKNNKPSVVGYYMSENKDDGNFSAVWLQAIEVADEYQHRGLAKQILTTALDEDDVANLAVDKDNEVAIELYKKFGFEPYCTNGKMVNMRLGGTKEESAFISTMNEDVIAFEDQMYVYTEGFFNQKSYDSKLRKYLWSERLRTSSDQIMINNKVKEMCPKVLKAFVKPNMYAGKNVFIDLSYYNRIFLENNKTVKDIAINFYWEYLNRMLNNLDPYFKQNYSKNTVFIPVWKGAWDVVPGSEVYDWKVNLNPISLIFRMIRKNPGKLASEWGGKDFIFIGKTGFFRVNFATFKLKNLTRFKINLEKLYREEKVFNDVEEDGYGKKPFAADKEQEEENSTAGIVTSIVDKIEKATGVTINNVSYATNNNPEESIMPTTDMEFDVPNLRIRTGKLPHSTVDMAVGIMAPTQNDVVDNLTNDFWRSFGQLGRHSAFYSKK